MRPAIACMFFVALLGGCVEEAPEEGPQIPEGAILASDACPLTFPDGEPRTCVHQGWASAVAEPPGLTDGWRCIHESEDDFGNLYRRYYHADGRTGGYFEGSPWKDDAITIYQALWVREDGADAAVTLHAPSAFVELPAQEDGKRIDGYLTMREFRLFVKDPGGDWRIDQDAELVMESWDGLPWFSYRIERASGTYHVDIMGPDEDDDEILQWSTKAGKRILADGAEVIVDIKGNGVKHPDREPADLARAPPGCALTE